MSYRNIKIKINFNTFTAIVDLSRFNNSCLKSPASTFQENLQNEEKNEGIKPRNVRYKTSVQKM